MKGNIDDAFARRFQSMIYFGEPALEERRQLWKNLFKYDNQEQGRLESDVNLDALAEEYEITGGGIVNVLRYASLMTLHYGRDKIRLSDIREGVRRELHKDGRVA